MCYYKNILLFDRINQNKRNSKFYTMQNFCLLVKSYLNCIKYLFQFVFWQNFNPGIHKSQFEGVMY